MALLGLVPAAASADSNLVVNGRFQQPTPPGGSYGIYGSIPGWQETTGCGIELWGNNFIIPSPFQAQVLELNSNCPSRIQQTIPTTAGQNYLVTYYFGARPGYGTAYNHIQAAWNGATLADRVTANTTLTQYSFTVTGTGSDVLSFRSATGYTSLGTLLSLVSVTPADQGPQLEYTPADVSGWVGTQLSTTGKFVSSSGSALTMTASVGSVVAQPNGSFTWTYTPSTVTPAGGTTVTVTATDANNRSATTSFKMTANDPSPPSVASQIIGTPASTHWYTAATLDPIVGWLVSDPQSPITYEQGCQPQAVTYDTKGVSFSCTATSAGGTTSSVSPTVMRDATPPTLTLPTAPIVLEAAGPSGAIASYLVSTTDDTSGPGPVLCDQPSGGTFPIADTTVNCSTADKAGNPTNGSFTISVKDTIAPTLAVPADKTAEATGPDGAAVSFGAPTATDVVDGTVPVACDHNSGDTFALGTTTVNCSATDSHGNPGHASFDVTVSDTTNPTIDGSQDPNANGFGWNNTPVKVAFVCGDGGSGVDHCEDPVTLATETLTDGQMVHGHVVDKSGNTAETTVGPIKIDLTKPTLTGAATAAPNALGWYSADVTIAWDAQDGLSQIDPATVPDATVLHGEGAGLTAGPTTVKDKAGNESDATDGPAINIDRSPPAITAATTDTPNISGWFNKAVTVAFTCSDKVSGVQECPGDVALSNDGTGQSAAGTATDNADNPASTSVDGIKIDSHAPQSVATIECSQVNGYCHGGSATVNVTATDPAPADGVVTSGVHAIEYRVGTTGDWTTSAGDIAHVDVPLSGSGQAVVEYRAVDAAGNTEATNASKIDYDTIAPTVTHELAPAANASGWNNADATVHFAATDEHPAIPADGSPSGLQLASITGDQLVDSETLGLEVNGQATDKAGNTGYDSVTVKLDKTNPTIVAGGSGTNGANGWYTSAVTVRFTCADPGALASGVQVCTSDQVLQNGDATTGTVKDVAGNTDTASYGPVKVDGQKPSIGINGVADGGIYQLGAVPPASCTATDVGPSGIDGGCQITVTGGLANGVGKFAYTATAKDMAGNSTTVTGSYAVRYAVKTGTAFWLQPINDTAHTTSKTTSVFNAGSTVPAKFRLFDAHGNVVQTNTPPLWLNPVRGRSTAQPVDESVYGSLATTGDAFKSSADGQYQYNWATPKAGTGYFWRIGVALDDGTTQTVSIALR